jgi:hypothetical protein
MTDMETPPTAKVRLVVDIQIPKISPPRCQANAPEVDFTIPRLKIGRPIARRSLPGFGVCASISPA